MSNVKNKKNISIINTVSKINVVNKNMNGGEEIKTINGIDIDLFAKI